MKKIPVTIPYFTEDESIEVEKVLASGWVAQGPVVECFEHMVAAHENIENGVATTSCTTALHLAMVAEKMGAGMDVIAPAYTFVATVNAIVETGAVPVLVDVHPETFNINVGKIEELIKTNYRQDHGQLRNKTSGNILWGIIPVHEFGLCCDILEVNALADRYQLKIIEDAACALGACIHRIHAGGFGNPACFSFHPRKSITTGEGGMVLTNDTDLAKRMKQLRTHGSTVSADQRHQTGAFLLPEFENAGFNYRMTDIQAAVGVAQMKKLDYILAEKRKKAKLYDSLIQQYLPAFIVPSAPDGYFHTYQSYVCMLDLKMLGFTEILQGEQYRNWLLRELEMQGISTRQGTHAVHMLGYYKKRFGYQPDDFPSAWACSCLSIALPLYVQMGEEDQIYVIQTIRQLMEQKKQEDKHGVN